MADILEERMKEAKTENKNFTKMMKDPNSLGDVKLNGGDITFDDHGNALCVTKTVLGPNLPNVTKT